MSTTAEVERVESDTLKPGVRKTRRGFDKGWFFVLPLLLLNLLVVTGPALAGVYYSFTDWTGLGSAKWVGLQNYVRLLGDADFRSAFVHNLIWTALFLVVPISLGLFGAFLLSRIKRFGIFFRVAYFIPYILASVVNAAIWRNLLDPEAGVIAAIAKMGLTSLDGFNLLGNTATSLYTVAFVDNWHWWGFLVVIFLTAMRDVDPSIYEASRLDGANAWQEFRYITVPSIQTTITFMLLMTVIWSFMSFDYVFILTGGGPAGSSDVVSTYIYREAFKNRSAGYAAAASMSLAFISIFIGGCFLLVRRLRKDK